MSRSRMLGYTMLIAATLATGACMHRTTSDSPPLATEAKIDLPRYMGSWYVIANIPYFGERGNVAAFDEYKLTPDGKVDTIYHYHKKFGAPEKTIGSIATVTPGSDNARWVVTFFKLFHADYWILDVAPDYSWALIGQPSRKLGWVFSRTPQMSEDTYQTLIEKFRTLGYDTGKFRRVPQMPDQAGKPGFQ